MVTAEAAGAHVRQPHVRHRPSSSDPDSSSSSSLRPPPARSCCAPRGALHRRWWWSRRCERRAREPSGGGAARCFDVDRHPRRSSRRRRKRALLSACALVPCRRVPARSASSTRNPHLLEIVPRPCASAIGHSPVRLLCRFSDQLELQKAAVWAGEPESDCSPRRPENSPRDLIESLGVNVKPINENQQVSRMNSPAFVCGAARDCCSDQDSGDAQPPVFVENYSDSALLFFLRGRDNLCVRVCGWTDNGVDHHRSRGHEVQGSLMAVLRRHCAKLSVHSGQSFWNLFSNAGSKCGSNDR